jgi:hypothetical protein
MVIDFTALTILREEDKTVELLLFNFLKFLYYSFTPDS